MFNKNTATVISVWKNIASFKAFDRYRQHTGRETKTQHFYILHVEDPYFVYIYVCAASSVVSSFQINSYTIPKHLALTISATHRIEKESELIAGILISHTCVCVYGIEWHKTVWPYFGWYLFDATLQNSSLRLDFFWRFNRLLLLNLAIYERLEARALIFSRNWFE